MTIISIHSLKESKDASAHALKCESTTWVTLNFSDTTLTIFMPYDDAVKMADCFNSLSFRQSGTAVDAGSADTANPPDQQEQTPQPELIE